MPMVLLRLYHQYQQTVFIQPSITKGSAGRPLIDYFNWLVGGGNHGWKAVYLNQLRGNLERGLISSSWSPLCGMKVQRWRRCVNISSYTPNTKDGMTISDLSSLCPDWQEKTFILQSFSLWYQTRWSSCIKHVCVQKQLHRPLHRDSLLNLNIVRDMLKCVRFCFVWLIVHTHHLLNNYICVITLSAQLLFFCFPLHVIYLPVFSFLSANVWMQ